MTRATPLLTLASLLSQRLHPSAVADDEWSRVVPLALEHSLAPMLLWIIEQRQLPFRSVWTPLLTQARQAAGYALLLEETQREINIALTAAQVPVIWLKGSALAITVYPKPELRPMLDLDALIHKEHRQVARSIFLQSGCQEDNYRETSADGFARRMSHHDRFWGGKGSSIPIELHFRLLATEGEKLLPPEKLAWFYQETQTIEYGNQQLTVPKSEAHLLYLVAHALLQHGEGAFLLLRYLDIHLLITRSEVDWALVVDQAVSLRWTFAVERALTLTRQYFETPIPDRVFDQLRQRRPGDEDVSRVTRLQSRAVRWQQMRRLLGELSFPDQVRAVRQVLLPSPAFMRQRYAIRAAWLVWPYYLYRWFDQGREVTRAVTFRLARILRKNS